MDVRFGLRCIAFEHSVSGIVTRAEIVFEPTVEHGAEVQAYLYREAEGERRRTVRSSVVDPASPEGTAELQGYIADACGEMIEACCRTPDGYPERMRVRFTEGGFELYSDSREAVRAAFLTVPGTLDGSLVFGLAIGIDDEAGEMVNVRVEAWDGLKCFLRTQGIDIGFGERLEAQVPPMEPAGWRPGR